MKQLKFVLLGLAAGVLVGLALGVNIGRDKPLLANPFERESLDQKLKRLGGETLEKSGKVLEQTGQALQEKLNK